MKVTLAICILLTLLLCGGVKGVAIIAKSSCLCKDAGVNFISRRTIEKVEIYSPSPFCHHTEIIVFIKNEGGQKCLNPESNFARIFIKGTPKEKGRKAGFANKRNLY